MLYNNSAHRTHAPFRREILATLLTTLLSLFLDYVTLQFTTFYKTTNDRSRTIRYTPLLLIDKTLFADKW